MRSAHFFRVPKVLTRIVLVVLLALSAVAPLAAFADADEYRTGPAGPSAGMGLQPLPFPAPLPTTLPGESRLTPRIDGIYVASPEVRGTTKIFHITARRVAWALRKDLRVYANAYDGVVPGPALIVNQGDLVVIDYRNRLGVADTIHLHGIHGGPVEMDGVAGISQPMVPPGGSFRYVFRASQPGTFIYHSHGDEAMLDSGLYGPIVVLPRHPRPEERVDRDDIELVSGWQIQSASENHFTINGREYPSTWPIEVKPGERVRLRWIDIASEGLLTIDADGHDQLVIARDAQPVAVKELQESILIGPGQRVDTVITADQQPGTWLVESDFSNQTEDARGLPAGPITAIHYDGAPYLMPALGNAARLAAGVTSPSFPWATVLGTAALVLTAGLLILGYLRAEGGRTG